MDLHPFQSPAPSQPGIVTVPTWARLPWLRAAFSTRQGGATTVYSADGSGEQNLGWTDADTANVTHNRHRFLKAVVSDDAATLVTIRQIHGNVVRVIGGGGGPLATPDGRAILEGDGLITTQPGLVLGIQTADCVPVLIADTRTRAVAAFHAGWRGTLARIVERGIAALQQDLGSQPQDLVAAIGPAIRPCCFTVGDEVRAQFEREFTYAQELFPRLHTAGQPPTLDLQEANRRQLLDAGVAPKSICVIAECTACTRLANNHRKYFSHRAEQGFTGRMLSVIGTLG